MTHPNPLHRPAGLLLDMDGTLTEPMLDFPAIKREMGIGEQPILEAMAEMSVANRERAEAILLRHEERAAVHSSLASGCVELMGWIAEMRLPAALITRNSRLSAETVLSKHRITFRAVITRDDAPPKPDTRALHLACQRMGVAPTDVWMIGDGRYDIEAGNLAGIRTVWISQGRERVFDAVPSRSVGTLHDLLALLRSSSAPANDYLAKQM